MGLIFTHVTPDYAAYATPTQIWALAAGPTKNVRLLYLSVEAVATAAAAMRDVYLVRGTAAVTGGTATDNSANTAPMMGATIAEAKPFSYSVIPTTITPGPTIKAGRVAVPAVGSALALARLEFDWTACRDLAPIIPAATANAGAATANSSFMLKLDNAALPAGFSAYINATWEEL